MHYKQFINGYKCVDNSSMVTEGEEFVTDACFQAVFCFCLPNETCTPYILGPKLCSSYTQLKKNVPSMATKVTARFPINSQGGCLNNPGKGERNIWFTFL